jgi:hypothetical protein
LAAGTRQLLFERSTPYKVMEGQLLSVMADSSSISAVLGIGPPSSRIVRRAAVMSRSSESMVSRSRTRGA